MPSNLLKRRNRYYVRVAVPRSLWGVVGKQEIQRTTGTADPVLAERRKHAIIAEIKDEIDGLSGPEHDPRFPAWLNKQARALRKDVQAGELDQDLANVFIGILQEQHLKALGETPDSAPEAIAASARSAARLVSDLEYTPLSELIETYLKDRAGRVENSTLHVKRRELEAFAQWLPGSPTVSDIDRKATGRYVSEVLGQSTRSPKTQKSVVSVLSAFWNWCIRKGHTEKANPWSGLGEDLKGSTRGGNGNGKRRPWKPEEIANIDTIPADDPMYLLCRIALYSGMRLNEIAHLELADIDLKAGMFMLPEGKTESSVRQVPIHSALLPLIERLCAEAETAESTFIIPGLKPGGLDKKRGTAVGKRIGRWIRKNVTKDKGVVFHSLRNTFMHACENASVLESTTQLIVGHARQSLTYGLYSPGVHFELLQDAIEKVSFGELEAAA